MSFRGGAVESQNILTDEKQLSLRAKAKQSSKNKIDCHPELDSGSHKRSKKSFDGEIAYQVRYDKTKNKVLLKT